ncbi:hypothetical protein SPG90_21830 (plasmid) [Enterobacter sp. D2]|uniref:hypothetical protein n=1 Tax=Enterobacter sp. D2 TaxID=3102784 RepID=UPI002ACA9E0D|nr:hypothetical protein [Enterobacter sp. D2]MDZ5731129.1 hypothetical protein [Enterobacter sp. D2]
MKKALSVVCCSLFMSLFSLSAHSVQNEEYQAYREYFPLAKKVESASKIVVFFSFASRESYELIYKNGLLRYLNVRGYDVELIPVDFFSPYDNYLAERWHLESSNGFLIKNYEVSSEGFFYNVFHNMRGLKYSGRDINADAEMSMIVNISGFAKRLDELISKNPFRFEGNIIWYNSKRKEMIQKFNVTSVPSVYIKGEYLINDSVMSTRKRISEGNDLDYVNLIRYLLEKKSD